MQPPQARCGLCGTRLGKTDGQEISLREIANLAGSLVILLGGFVLLSTLVIAGLFWLLR